MDVLIIGSGGREHALAWKMAQSRHVGRVYVAPGNAGTQRETGVANVAIAADDVSALVAFARARGVGLTVVGPEAPLVAGVVDTFQDAGLRCYGPNRAAAELEGSKAFSKDFLARHTIPTADYRSFIDLERARGYILDRGAPIVVKADGLAAGKGVTVAFTVEEALRAAAAVLADEGDGRSSPRVVVEEYLDGEEVSFIAMVDGDHTLPMATSQDHKARDDGDCGPNTGGMGAYSPAPVVSAELNRRIMDDVVRPTVAGLAAEGRRYVGFLYAGLMITADGEPKVLEFNVRLGDPEAQPLLMRLRSDLFELCMAALDGGKLDGIEVDWDPRACVGVVMAAGGYPERYPKGQAVNGLPTLPRPDSKVFHAGTAVDAEGRIVTAGGRVLCACALGETVATAAQAAYALVHRIHWQGVHYRSDIGYRAIRRGR